MRPSLICLSLCFFFPTLARAADDASTPPLPAFSALPVGKITPPPKKRPSSVGAGEKVKGVFITRPHSEGPALVAGSRAAASRLTGRQDPDEEDTSRDVCLTEAGTSFDGGAPEWERSSQPFVTLHASRGNERVTGVHLEQVVEESERGAVLEVTDAWVDQKTHGARLIGKSKVPLQLVATAPGDIRVYAAREDERVHFVLVEPRRTARTWQGIFIMGEQVSQSACRHARVTLDAARGSAAASTFLVTTELPPEQESTSPQEGAGLETLRTSGVADSGADHVVRNRSLRVHTSTSWTSSDREPVVSVALGWEARERSVQSFRIPPRPKMRISRK